MEAGIQKFTEHQDEVRRNPAGPGRDEDLQDK
jgi:hypothetical protein